VKYSKELYEQTEFCPMDDEITNHIQKVVKCRTEHECSQCGSEIKFGSEALCETAIVQGQGRVSVYTCMKCCDAWLDKTEIADKAKEEV
jgi:hypothetical protein